MQWHHHQTIIPIKEEYHSFQFISADVCNYELLSIHLVTHIWELENSVVPVIDIAFFYTTF